MISEGVEGYVDQCGFTTEEIREFVHQYDARQPTESDVVAQIVRIVRHLAGDAVTGLGVGVPAR